MTSCCFSLPGRYCARAQHDRKAFRGVESSVEILESVLDIQEVKVLGDHAFQWGTYRYSLRPRAGGETVHTSGKLMRILQRQPNGSWKMHRSIATVDPPT